MCQTVLVSEVEQVLGGEPGALGLVGVDDRVVGAAAESMTTTGQPGGQFDVGLVERCAASMTMTTPSTACSRSRAKATADVAPGSALDGHERDRVAGARGLDRDGVERAHVAERREREHDDADAAEAPRSQGAGGRFGR